MRYEYFEIFYQNSDGSICSEFPIRINGITVPAGTCFKPGTSFGGLDIAGSIGRDVKATIHDENVFVIEKFL